VEPAASSTQLTSPGSSMSSEVSPRRKGRSLLKKASRSERLELTQGAYTLMMISVPSVAAIARPEGILVRLVTITVSRVRMAVTRRDVPLL